MSNPLLRLREWPNRLRIYKPPFLPPISEYPPFHLGIWRTSLMNAFLCKQTIKHSHTRTFVVEDIWLHVCISIMFHLHIEPIYGSHSLHSAPLCPSAYSTTTPPLPLPISHRGWEKDVLLPNPTGARPLKSKAEMQAWYAMMIWFREWPHNWRWKWSPISMSNL